jgi:hypothetical protein
MNAAEEENAEKGMDNELVGKAKSSACIRSANKKSSRSRGHGLTK